MVSESSPSVNAIPSIVIYDPVLATPRYATGTVLTNATPQHVAIVDGDGTQITSFGGGTQYTEDAAAAANPIGNATILVRTDTPATQVTTDGDNIAQRGTNYGAAYVQLVTSSGAYIDSVGGGTEYTEDSAAAANPVGKATILVRTDTPATQVTTDGDNVAQRGTNYGAAYVQLVTSAGAYIDSVGGGTQYTEGATDASITGTAMLMEGAADTLLPVQGTVADGLLVNLGTNNDVTVTGNVAVTNAGLTELAAAINASSQVDVNIAASGATVPVSGTFWQATQPVSGTVTANAGTNLNTSLLALETGGNLATIAGDTTSIDGKIPVLGQALATGSVPVVLTAAQITTLTPLATVAVTNADLTTIAGDTTSIQTAVELIDDAVYVDDADWTGDTSKHLLVGGVYQSVPQTVTDGDVAPISLNVNGAVRVVTSGGVLALPNIDSYAHAAISTTANTADQSLVAQPGANKQIWVYAISYVVGTAAGTVSFQDEDNTAITGVMAHALNSGMSVPPSGNLSMPIWKLATNKALEVDCVTCDIEGWVDYAIVSV